MEFMCRDCYTMVAWQTAKSGKKYLAERKEWFGDQYFAQRVYWPFHSCTPIPERQAEYAAEQAATAIAREERQAAQVERAARAEALLGAGVTVPSGKTTITGSVVSIKVQDDYYSGGVSLKMLVESDEGWKVWGSVPRALWASSDATVRVGDSVTFTATVEPSADDVLFGFFKRPTKASFLQKT